jgi:hypothetical protein
VVPNDGRSKIKEMPRKAQPLQESDGNSLSPRKTERTTTKAKDTTSSENKDSPLAAVTRRSQTTASKSKYSTASMKEKDSRIPRKVRFSISYLSSSSSALTVEDNEQTQSSHFKHKFIDPLQTLKRLSSPHPHAEERSPKRSSSPQLTTQEKLNIAQAEAEAAAVAAGLVIEELDIELEGLEKNEAVRTEEEIKPRGRRDLVSHSRKTKIGGRPRRRKSTLTPEELESLMFVN